MVCHGFRNASSTPIAASHLSTLTKPLENSANWPFKCPPERYLPGIVAKRNMIEQLPVDAPYGSAAAFSPVLHLEPGMPT